MRKLTIFPFLVLLASCQEASKVEVASVVQSSENSQIAAIETEIRSNPKVTNLGVGVGVSKLENGYLTLTVSGLDTQTATQLDRGKDMSTILMVYDGSVGPLVELEAILRENHGIKSIIWQAN